MEIVGIIDKVSRKADGRNAFTLVGKDQWFNGFKLEADSGDKITFKETINGTFHNYADVVKMPSDEVTSEHPMFKPASQLMSAKDIMIVAQCLTKVCYQGGLTYSMGDVLKTYRDFVKELENNG